MKKQLLVMLLLCFTFALQAQTKKSDSYSILRSNLGTSGSSQEVTTNKGTYNVSQSIGQSSAIGTHFNKGYYLRQGYQQPLYKISVVKESNGSLNAVVHPNPFKESVSISFRDKISDEILVSVFDVNGRLVYNVNHNASPLININLNDISSGTYFMKVSSGSKLLNAKLIKK